MVKVLPYKLIGKLYSFSFDNFKKRSLQDELKMYSISRTLQKNSSDTI